MVISIFMPESTILPAFAQWREAREIRKKWCDNFHITEGDPFDIGMEGGFFVVMGGIGVGTQDIHGKCRTILTARGFKHYLAAGDIKKEHLCKDNIVDKGKASMIVKLLVFTQAAWFVVGSFSRIAVGLPISLLEIHVIIQVFGALTAYCFWFYKPLDVEQPIFLDIAIDVNNISHKKDPPVDENTPINQDANNPTENDKSHKGDPIPETTKYPTDFDFVTEDARSSIVTVILRAVSSTGEFVLDQNHRNLYAVAFLIALNAACHGAAYLVQFPSKLERTLWLICCGSSCVVPFVVASLLQLYNCVDKYYHSVWEQRFTKRRNAVTHVIEIFVSNSIQLYTFCTSGGHGWSKWLVHAPFRYFAFCLLANLILYHLLCVYYIMLESVLSLRSLPIGLYTTPIWSNYVPQIS